MDVLCLADRYQLMELKSSLEFTLSNHLSINTIFQFFFYAEAYNCHYLLQRCTTYIKSNTRLVLCSEVILNLPFNHFRSFISRDQLLVEEIVIVETVQKWIFQNEPNREQKKKLLKCVRLSEMSSSQLSAKVLTSGLFDQSIITNTQDSINEDSAGGQGKIGKCLHFCVFI